MCFNELEGLEDNREDRFMTNFCRRGGRLLGIGQTSHKMMKKKKKKTLKASVAFRAAAAASGTLTLQQW